MDQFDPKTSDRLRLTMLASREALKYLAKMSDLALRRTRRDPFWDAP
jgi:hypothetical protein